MNSISNSWLLQGLAALVALVFCFQTVVGQEDLHCRNNELNMTEAQKNILLDCTRDVGKSDSIWRVAPDKVSCFGVCILERKKLLTADGMIDHQKFLDYVQDVMKPDEVKKPLVDGTDQCIKEHGSKIKEDISKDPNCLAFMETGKCIHDVFVGICVEG